MNTKLEEPQRKPLASPVSEYRLIAFASIGSGCVFAVTAIAIGPPAAALIALVSSCLFFGLAMHLLLVRRFLRTVTAEPTPIGTAVLESPDVMRRRHLKVVASQVVFVLAVGVLAVIQGLSALVYATFAAGMFLGGGMVMLGAARSLARWQAAHSATLFRDPAFRWRREPRSVRRGSGFMDGVKFFVLRDPV